MELRSLRKKPLPQIPSEIADALNKSKITKTPFERKDEVLSNSELQTEIGYTKMDDGSYLVSMVCPMPGITVDMIEWWFWWHAQDNLRYQVWFPASTSAILIVRRTEHILSNHLYRLLLPILNIRWSGSAV